MIPPEAEPARQLLLEFFPGTDPAWLGGDKRGDRRIDTFLALAGPEDHAYHVSSLRIDGCFVADAISEYPHVPYDTAHVNAKPPRGGEPGVFASVTPIRSPAATQARFVQRGLARTAPVIRNHCVLFDWDTTWLPANCRPVPAALLIGGTWIPTVSGVVAATPGDFRRAYSARCDTGSRDADWAVIAFFEGTFEDRLRMVECVMDGDSPSDRTWGCLAAGPVEDLLGHALLDRITRSDEMRRRWVPLLQGINWKFEPPDVQRRVQALLDFPEDAQPGGRRR